MEEQEKRRVRRRDEYKEGSRGERERLTPEKESKKLGETEDSRINKSRRGEKEKGRKT